MLYIVATPIGNLDDLTMRALRTLQSVDVILCEDTRVTRTLLKKFEIEKKLVQLHEHTEPHELRAIVDSLENGIVAALVSDAGTPAIADPGVQLIQAVQKRGLSVKIIPIPGASSVAAALSVAGMWANQYQFLGFVPQKKGRESFFINVENSTMTTVIFETPQRIEKTISALANFKNPGRKITICRELTKQFETIYYTTVGEIGNVVKDIKGEFVIVIEGNI